MELTQKQLEKVRKHFRLSPRQAEVANLLFRGRISTKEIAKELKVTPGVTRQYIYQIHTKMRTESKGQVIIKILDYIIENNIL